MFDKRSRPFWITEHLVSKSSSRLRLLLSARHSIMEEPFKLKTVSDMSVIETFY